MRTALEDIGSWNLKLTNDYLKTGTVLGKTPVLELISEPVLELKTKMRNLLKVTRYEKVHNRCN